jgi:hypothetical protein
VAQLFSLGGFAHHKFMDKKEIQSLLDMFADGSGYGDPEARRNAELRLQILLARQQDRTARYAAWVGVAGTIIGVIIGWGFSKL